jgi:uncharacterized protein (TIGR00369 family)
MNQDIFMNDSLKIKNIGASMVLDAESSDKQEFGSFYLSRYLGFEISYRKDICIVKFIIKPPMYNPQGTLHGGIIATAMDVSMGHLLNHTSGSGATLEMNIKYLLPIFAECVTCKGSYLRQGKSISFLQSHMYKENGNLAAYASATWIPLKK